MFLNAEGERRSKDPQKSLFYDEVAFFFTFSSRSLSLSGLNIL